VPGKVLMGDVGISVIVIIYVIAFNANANDDINMLDVELRKKDHQEEHPFIVSRSACEVRFYEDVTISLLNANTRQLYCICDESKDLLVPDLFEKERGSIFGRTVGIAPSEVVFERLDTICYPSYKLKEASWDEIDAEISNEHLQAIPGKPWF
jgi:hypothetical protein